MKTKEEWFSFLSQYRGMEIDIAQKFIALELHALEQRAEEFRDSFEKITKLYLQEQQRAEKAEALVSDKARNRLLALELVAEAASEWYENWDNDEYRHDLGDALDDLENL